MSRIIVENCLKISISTVNDVVGAEAKRLALEPGLCIDKESSPHQWGLADFFLLEKPEWLDMDEWLEETTFDSSFLLRLGCGSPIQGELRIKASPLKKNQLIFTHKRYGDDQPSPESYTVNLLASARKYGGFQYYFLCPRQLCQREVSMLYLPPGATFFGCRRCHNLSYASCNVSRPGRGGSVSWNHLLRSYEKIRSEAYSRAKQRGDKE